MATAGTQARLGAQILKTFKPTISDQTRFGPGCRDNATQTDRSDIVQLEETYVALENLLAMAAALKKDLSMSTYTLRMESRNLISDHATELYHHANNRLMEMEKRHRAQTDMLRRSFRTQLSDAVARISAEYKTYYDEILSGKTGRHDRKIQELVRTCAEQQSTLKQNEIVIQMLQAQIQKLSAEVRADDTGTVEVVAAPPTPIGGCSLSQEEADELQATVENLELQVRELQLELGDRESGSKAVQRALADVRQELELERAKAGKLRSELDSARRGAAEEGARSAADAQTLIATLRQQLEEQRDKLQLEAEQRLRDALAAAQSSATGKLEAELARQREVEERLRRERDTLASQDSSKVVRQLQEQAAHLQATIGKLQRDLRNAEERWRQRLAATELRLVRLREESFVRTSLGRQAATLHRAAITYAPDGPVVMAAPGGAGVARARPLPARPGDFPGALPSHVAAYNDDATALHDSYRYGNEQDVAAATWRQPTPTRLFPPTT